MRVPPAASAPNAYCVRIQNNPCPRQAAILFTPVPHGTGVLCSPAASRAMPWETGARACVLRGDTRHPARENNLERSISQTRQNRRYAHRAARHSCQSIARRAYCHPQSRTARRFHAPKHSSAKAWIPYTADSSKRGSAKPAPHMPKLHRAGRNHARGQAQHRGGGKQGRGEKRRRAQAPVHFGGQTRTRRQGWERGPRADRGQRIVMEAPPAV